MLEHEANDGDALVLGLFTHLNRPQFIVTLYFLSDVLQILGDLSRAFQNNQVNLISVQGLLDKLSALEHIRSNIFQGGYMLALANDYPDALSDVSSQFETEATNYLERVISNIRNRFPNVRLLTLLGYIHPMNAAQATLSLIMELGHLLDIIDAAHLCNEFTAYQNFVQNLYPKTLHQAVFEMWCSEKRQTMTTAYPLVSTLLAKLIVLPASSAEVEQTFFAMNRIKAPLRTRMNIKTLDSLIQISTLQKIWHYFPTNIGVFLSQIVHPHHISEVKHIDVYVTTYILCLVINIQIYVVVARPIFFFTMLLRAFYDKGRC